MAKKRVRQSPARDSQRRIEGWTKAVGIGRTKFYALPPELRPRMVKLGTATVIVETPEEYLRRIAEMQEAA